MTPKELLKQAVDSAINLDTKQRDNVLRQIFAQKAADIISRSTKPTEPQGN